MKLLARTIGVMTLSAALISCGDDEGTDPPEGPTVVANASDQFVPASLDVDVGETVTWVFGAVAHDVKFSEVAGAPTDIGISVNQNVSRTFPTAGVYPYDCTIHAGMSGTVRVGQ